jgi:hypothetical protein
VKRVRAFIVISIVAAASVAAHAAANQPLYTFLNDTLDDAFAFRCLVKSKDAAPATAHVVVNFQDERNTYRVELTPQALNVSEVRSGRSRLLAQARRFYDGVTMTPASLIIKRNGAFLSVIYGGRTLISVSTNTFRGGRIGYGSMGGSAEFSETRYQPIEPVHFSDDFMRTSNDAAQWSVLDGAWRLQAVGDPRLAANGFFYVGQGAPRAIAATGHWFWSDYTLRASVRAKGAGAMGVCAYLQDKDNYFLFRWDTHRKELIKVFQGHPIPIADAPGGFEPNQWYRLTLSVQGDTLRAAIDGVPIFESKGQTLFGQGKIGLYCEGDVETNFDDVLVTPADEPDAETIEPQFTRQFTLEQTMEGWANAKGEWTSASATPDTFYHRGTFFGDHALKIRLTNVGATPASLNATLCGDGVSLTSGYTLQLDTSDGKTVSARLLRQGQPVTQVINLPYREPMEVCLERRGREIHASLASHPLWRFDDRAPLSGRKAGYQAQGWRVSFAAAEVQARQVLDYTFYRAPTDWRVTAGTWEVASRWTCSPGWSWFGGWSRDLAAVWNKREFAGDVVVQMFVAPRMDPQDTYQRVGNLCITLCGDGNDVNSGYNFVFAGDHNRVTRLLRGNQVVQETNQVLLPVPFHGAGHRRWFHVTAEKIGNTVSLYVDHQLAARFTDPQPLTGRRVALWTRNSGMMVARATIYYERETVAHGGWRMAESKQQPLSASSQPTVAACAPAIRHPPSATQNSAACSRRATCRLFTRLTSTESDLLSGRRQRGVSGQPVK